MPAVRTSSFDADAMRTRRKALRLTQRALAQRAALSEHHVSSIERGRRRPSLAAVAAVADALDLPRAALIAEAVR